MTRGREKQPSDVPGNPNPLAVGLLLAVLLSASTPAQAAGPPRTLAAPEIRQRLVGKVISDGAHWHYYLKRNGQIDGEELNRPRKGKWYFRGERLCIVIFSGAAPNECWNVSAEGKTILFGTGGSVIYQVRVRSPPL